MKWQYDWYETIKDFDWRKDGWRDIEKDPPPDDNFIQVKTDLGRIFTCAYKDSASFHRKVEGEGTITHWRFHAKYRQDPGIKIEVLGTLEDVLRALDVEGEEDEP